MKEGKCYVFQKVSTIYGFLQLNGLKRGLDLVREWSIGTYGLESKTSAKHFKLKQLNNIEGRKMLSISKSINYI